MEISTCSDVAYCDPLPEELVLEILTRLPVKSLIQFRCVSRRWMDLIKKPSFISRHLTRMKNIFCGYNFHNSCAGVVVSANDWMGNFEDRKPTFPYDFLKLNIGPYLPYKPSYGGDGYVENKIYSITGYCDGIFCLSWNHLYRHNSIYRGSNYNPGHIVIALCNPALRELRILPLSNTDFPPYKKHRCVEIGFGFDPKANDYKVVKIVMFDNVREALALDCIEIYSLASNSWQMVHVRGNNNYVIPHNLKPCAFAAGIYTSTGVLYWTMSCGQCHVIGSFNIEDESLRVINLPTKYISFQERTGWSRQHKLFLLNDRPALMFGFDTEEEFEGTFEIFLLSDHDQGDDVDSWYLATVLESFPLHLQILGFWMNIFLLVFNYIDNFPLLYDIVSKQYVDLTQHTSERGFFYRESLISVKQGCEDCYTTISPREFRYSTSHFF